MLSGLSPALDAEMFQFVSFADGQLPAEAIASAICCFREAEGVSLTLPRDGALSLGFADESPMRQITLEVYSSLEGIGLTAAVARRLADNGIACNMIAAFHHDHVFVPADRAEEALALLQDLQREAG